MPDRSKWARDLEYERIAHQRMKEVAEAYPDLLMFTYAEMLKRTGLPQAYRYGTSNGGPAAVALVGRELVSPVGGKEPLDLRWHISVNGGADLPSWHMMADAAHHLRPGVMFVIGVPPRSLWMPDVTSGKNVLHLWQVKDENLERSWTEQRTPGGRSPS